MCLKISSVQYFADIHTNVLLNPFAALVTSYLVTPKLVAVCPYDEYTRHESHSSNA